MRVLLEFQNDWNLTVTAHQTFGLDASKLSDYLRSQADQLRQTNLVLVIALLGALWYYAYAHISRADKYPQVAGM